MITVIVPIYNTERYLTTCLDSIANQTFKDLEIICVNDCSPGNCKAVLEKYQKKDSRFVIIDKSKNEGLEMARYSGLQRAKGDYILHVDSDDWLEGLDIIQVMYQTAIETGADYVEVNSQRVLDRHKWIKIKNKPQVTGIIKKSQPIDDNYISYFGVNILSVNIWGKLYKRETLLEAGITPFGITMGEDLIYNVQLYPFLRKIVILDTIGYNYRFGGMTCRYNKKMYPDLKKIFYYKEKLIDRFEFQKATPFIRIEMKNVFKSEICQKITYKTSSKQQLLQEILNEICEELWSRIVDVPSHKNYMNDPFVLAIRNKDANSIYNICKKKVQKDKPQRIIKQIISKTLEFF